VNRSNGSVWLFTFRVPDFPQADFAGAHAAGAVRGRGRVILDAAPYLAICHLTDWGRETERRRVQPAG